MCPTNQMRKKQKKKHANVTTKCKKIQQLNFSNNLKLYIFEWIKKIEINLFGSFV